VLLERSAYDADVNFRGLGEGGMIVRIYEQHLPPSRILELIAAQG
jgi:hypothetical protein